jgi:hypothetical protein
MEVLKYRWRSTAANKRICAIGAEEYRPSTFVILLSFSNLAVYKLSYGQASCGNSNFPTAQMPGRYRAFYDDPKCNKE